jgi:hypothetical protein
MRGCALSFLLWMAGAVLSIAAVMAFFFYSFETPPSGSFGASIPAGGFVWISLNLSYSAWKSWRRRGAMRAAQAGLAVPADGRESVFVGALEPLGETLVAPLDGSPALLYDYTVKEEIGTGKQRFIYTHYKGVGLAPSVLRTRGGSYPLLAVPEFEGPSQPLDGDTRLVFAKYLRETKFTQRKEVKQRELEARWSDADGSYRSDITDVAEGKEVELANCRFEQHRVRPGEQVCIFGYYAAGRGIVPHANWANPTKLLVGDTTEVARALGSQVKTRIVLAILTAGAAAGIVAALVNS